MKPTSCKRKEKHFTLRSSLGALLPHQEATKAEVPNMCHFFTWKEGGEQKPRGKKQSSHPRCCPWRALEQECPGTKKASLSETLKCII